jgi:hypothetical protein
MFRAVMFWPVLFWSVLFGLVFVALASSAGAVEVPVRVPAPNIDGDLNEWGGATWVDIDPAANGVGLRGAYDGYPDHEADLLLYWDAEYLYVALSIADDKIDAGRIMPEEQVWERAGQRKDKMFYFDHLKIFVRGPEQPVGYNLWFGPQPYVWGGRQLSDPELEPPVEVAVGREEGLYTYEIAIPWTWLEIYPQSDMKLTALFLVSDSDDPGDEIGVKIARDKSAWIWWKGDLSLRGTPPGLKPPPELVETSQVDPRVDAPQVDAKIDGAIQRMQERRQQAAEAEVADKTAAVAAQKAAVVAAAQVDSAAAQAVQADSTGAAPPSTASVVARLNRKLLAKRTPRQWPDWIRNANTDKTITNVQIDSLLGQLSSQIYRLIDEEINSRTDGIVIDMAEKAKVRRGQAREYLRALVGAVRMKIGAQDKDSQAYLRNIADEAGVDEAAVLGLVQGICDEAEKNFERNKPTTTKALIKQGRRKAKLSEEETRQLLRLLVKGWKN